MTDRPMYHEACREWQDRFDTRRLADRLEATLARSCFSAEDREFVERQSMFFLATADPAGYPDCSYKGGPPGFVRVLDEKTLAFPSYDGNGMFRSVGNIGGNPRVGLLFLDFEQPRRLRISGTATVAADDPLRATWPGAQLVVRVRAEQIFPNCPRYVHRMQLVEPSPFVPEAGIAPPVPRWKTRAEFAEVLPRDDPARTPQAPDVPGGAPARTTGGARQRRRGGGIDTR